VFTHWGAVTPFVLRRGDQFRPPPPPALTSPAYAAAVNEVKSLGQNTSTTRTAEQTTIGQFWAAPIQNYWNAIADEVVLAQHSDIRTAARTLACSISASPTLPSPSTTPSTRIGSGGPSPPSASPTPTTTRSPPPTRPGRRWPPPQPTRPIQARTA
jgi:hypothetical protein